MVHHLLPGRKIVHFHAHFAHSPASVAMFASQLSGIPFSFTAHAKDIYTSDPRQLSEKIDSARFVVTCTEYNRNHLIKISGDTATPIGRIYHGIDPSLFSEKNVKQPDPPYHILTVARLTAKKGLPTVFRALQILCDRGVQLQYTLIGDGDQRKKILSLIKKRKLDRVTRWLGTQPHEVVIEQYRQSDLFVLGCEVAPNGDRDGIPNVLLESMAMGVPVVATRVSAIPELVENGQTGLLVPPGSPRQMAEAIHRLLVEQKLRRNVIRAGRARVFQEFDSSVLIRDLAALYRHEIEEFKDI
jgi:glycosyltransferase involved in cell wall biosynthesis